jgi:O-antigen ligase
MLLVTDFNFRLRDPNSQEFDTYVVVEIVVYAVAALGFSLFRVVPSARSYWRIRSLWLLAIYFTATTLWSPVPLLSLAFGVQLAVIALMTYVSSGHPSSRQFPRFLHGLVLLVLMGLASTFLLSIDRSGVAIETRSAFGWLYVHPNLVASYLAVATTITVFYVARRPGSEPWYLSRRVAILALLAEMIGLVATLSRTGMIAAIAGASVVVLLTARRKVQITVLAIAAGALIVLIAGSQIWVAVSRGQGAIELFSLSGRVDVWDYSLELVRLRPFVGYGLASARDLLLPVLNLRGAHNSFVELLLSGGILGLTLMMVPAIAATRSLLRAARQTDRTGRQTLDAVFAGLAVVWWTLSLTGTFGAGYPGLGTILLGILVARSVNLEILKDRRSIRIETSAQS